ncbi:MAG: hypothetical protein RIB93_12900 [Coleofasciculus sp. D1-CHI-01]|uniref:hypothetical protein n=1 Tax=Coleofasciculus sp. D1-CHI-01 TaxID=3068482 RepID=UPI0032FD7DC6
MKSMSIHILGIKNSTLWIYPPDLGDNLTKLPRYGEIDASESRSQPNCPTLILKPAVYCPPGWLRNQSPHFWHKELAYKGD